MKTQKHTRKHPIVYIISVLIVFLIFVPGSEAFTYAQPEETQQTETVPESTVQETVPAAEPEAQTEPEPQPQTTSDPEPEAQTELSETTQEETPAAETSPEEETPQQILPETEPAAGPAAPAEPETNAAETQTPSTEALQATEPETPPQTAPAQEHEEAEIPVEPPQNLGISTAYDGLIAETISRYLAGHPELSGTQKQILDACAYTGAAPAGYCASWVSRVYAAAGIYIGGNANDMWGAYCSISDRDELEPGMLVAVASSSTDPSAWGHYYGHIGIYIGDGYVVDSTTGGGYGMKTLNSLDNWIASYDVAGTVMWGFPPGAETEKEKPAPVMTEMVPRVIATQQDTTLYWIEIPDAFGYYIYRDGEVIANIRDGKTLSYVDEPMLNAGAVSYTVLPYTVPIGPAHERS